MGKSEESGFSEWIDGDDGGSSSGGFLEGGQHSGVIGAWVLAKDEDDVGFIKVLERYRAFADSNGFSHGDSTGFMAHVGAVGQVIGAILAGQELVEVGGFVAGSAGGVEEGVVRGGKFFQMVCDLFKCVVPGDGFVMSGTGGKVHGLGQAALAFHPVVGMFSNFFDTVFGKEVGGDFLGCALRGGGFGAVFAKFKGGAVVIRVGPGTAAAVEPIFLIHFQEGDRPSGQAFSGNMLKGDCDCLESGRMFVGSTGLKGSCGGFGRIGGWCRHQEMLGLMVLA